MLFDTAISDTRPSVLGLNVDSGAPVVGALDVSTGVGPERDGPFVSTALGRGPNAGTDRALVSFQQSDRIALLDLRAGTVLGDLPDGPQFDNDVLPDGDYYVEIRVFPSQNVEVARESGEKRS